MTFADLYGEAVTFELGSADTTELFTTVRRKMAINRAQREFARLTQCHRVELTQALTQDLAVYNLDSLSGDAFVNFDAKPLRLRRTTTATSATAITTLVRHDEAWLDAERPGWRDRPANGTPNVWAFRPEQGQNTVIVDPAPNIPSTETWDVLVPMLLTPTDMVADADQPFSYTADPNTALEPYHWALAHYAASLLERLRKDREAVETQINLFGAYVADYKARQVPRGGTLRVRQVRDYLRRTRHSGGSALVQGDPRV